MSRTTSPRRAQRQSLAIVVLSALAMVATSAPEPANKEVRRAQALREGNDESRFIVRISEDAVCEANSVGATVQMVVPATEAEMMAAPSELDEVVVQIVADDAPGTVVEQRLQLDGDTWVGSVSASPPIDVCAEDAACDLGFTVLLSPARDADFTVIGMIGNDESGCAISNPSLSDEATVEVVFP